MPEQRHFKPKWPDESNAPYGTYYPDNMEDRTPNPDVVPDEVIDIVWRINGQPAIFNNEGSQFTLFSKLPLELRRIIWRYSLPGPRVVAACCWSEDENPQCISDCSMPTALHVNQEARSAALESYKARFAISSAPEKPPEIYFNSEIDTLYLGVGNFSPSGEDPAAYFLPLLDPQDLASIKHLAIDSDIDTLYSDRDEGQLGLVNLGLNCLESVTIIKKREIAMDFVLQRSADGSSEYHAWQIDEEGKASPWYLSKDATCWDGGMSGYWGDVEEKEEIVPDEGPSIKTVRLVSWGALRRSRKWGARIQSLRRTVFVEETGCLYEDDGVIRRLVEMEDDVDTLKYDQLTGIINAGEELPVRLDPLRVYVWQQECSCRINHRQHIASPDWFPDPGKVDLQAVLQMLDDRQSA